MPPPGRGSHVLRSWGGTWLGPNARLPFPGRPAMPGAQGRLTERASGNGARPPSWPGTCAASVNSGRGPARRQMSEPLLTLGLPHPLPGTWQPSRPAARLASRLRLPPGLGRAWGRLPPEKPRWP